MLAHFLPPLEDVDCVGIDLYNKAAAVGQSWLTFRECMEGDTHGTFGNSVSSLLAAAPGKPWMLGEVGCHDAPGDKAAWITDMLKTLPQRYPYVRGLLWWNWNKPLSDGNYAISSGPVAQAFSAGLSDPHWLKAGGFPLDTGPFSLVETPDLDAQLASLKQQVVADQKALSDLQTQNAALKQQLADAQTGDQADAGQIAALKQQIQDAEERAATAEGKLAAIQANLQALVRLGSV